jgi:hypothetical protein
MSEERHVVVVVVVAFIEPGKRGGRDSVDSNRGAIGQVMLFFVRCDQKMRPGYRLPRHIFNQLKYYISIEQVELLVKGDDHTKEVEIS